MHAPVVTSGSQRHLYFLCLLYTFALPKRIWPGKVSYMLSPVFLWHFLEQYLTALLLLHCLKGEVPSFLPQNLQTQWDECALATPCSADAASVHFLMPFYIPLQNDCKTTFEAMIAVVYSCCPSWITLSMPKLWLVTRCIRPCRIILLGHWLDKKLFSRRQGLTALLLVQSPVNLA